MSSCGLLNQIETARARRANEKVGIILKASTHAAIKEMAASQGVGIQALTDILIQRGLSALRQAIRQNKPKNESSATPEYIERERGF